MNIPISNIEKLVKDPDLSFKRLRSELSWEKHGTTPRSEYYCNDNLVPYTYGSGNFARTYYPSPWHPVISEIRESLEKELNCVFDVCFLNMYENNKDHLGWHADDSPEMDDARPIVTVSLGAEREIWFKEKGASNKPEDVTKVLLKNGSACIMLPYMQKTHLHRIPKHDRDCGPRISLTFRGYVEPN